LLIFFATLGLGNPEKTVFLVTFTFGWEGGTVNLRTPSFDTSCETSLGLTPGGRGKRHIKERVNELFSSVILSRLTSTTMIFSSISIVTSSGWYLERSIAHYETYLIIFKIRLTPIYFPYQITVSFVVSHFEDVLRL
jgi:hypothetical protein